MIIETIINLFITVFDLLLTPIQIPSFPQEVLNSLNQYIEYLATGKIILSQFVPINYLLSLFYIAVTIEFAILIYHFIMWVIKKIPMLGIK